MLNRVLANAFFATAFFVALSFGSEEALRVYMAVTIGITAVLFNIGGMTGVGLVVAAMSIGILPRFYAPSGLVIVVYSLVVIGGGIRLAERSGNACP